MAQILTNLLTVLENAPTGALSYDELLTVALDQKGHFYNMLKDGDEFTGFIKTVEGYIKTVEKEKRYMLHIIVTDEQKGIDHDIYFRIVKKVGKKTKWTQQMLMLIFGDLGQIPEDMENYTADIAATLSKFYIDGAKRVAVKAENTQYTKDDGTTGTYLNFRIIQAKIANK